MPVNHDEVTYFPPLITPHRLRERDDAFSVATAQAVMQGAGHLYYVGRFELIEFAIVLEPEEPLRLARKIFYAGMNALADALAVLSPPEKNIVFGYPGTLYFDHALIGGGRLAWPDGTGPEDVPDWLVFSAMIRAGGVRDLGTGLGPQITTLDDEGFDAWNPAGFSASFARNFLVEVDQWSERGFTQIGPRYLARLEKTKHVKRRAIDTNGDLLVYYEGVTAPQRHSFEDALKAPDWYDPQQNEPRG